MIYFKRNLLVVLSLTLFHQALAGDVFDIPEDIKKLSHQKLNAKAIPKETGDKNAQFWLGEQANVKTTKAKKLEAQEWWYAAALKGHPGAIKRLSLSPKPTIITLKVSEEKLNMFRLKYGSLYEKAHAHDADSLFSLGQLYDQPTGEDIQHDGARALKYWSLAAKEKHKGAITKLYNLNRQAIEKKN
jgi:TPR repeat protein